MKPLFLLIACFFSFFSIDLSGQRTCHTMDHLAMEIQENPKRENKLREIEEFTQNALRSQSTRRSVITIPIVFHVVYNTSSENISDAQIFSQLDSLNKDFRRMNADTTNTPQPFKGVAADVEIEFCLATVAPDGSPSNGITRTATTVTSHGTDNSVKFTSSGGIDAWPTDQYLNVWVCNIGGGILGYAQFPGGGPASTDGVVNDYRYTGSIGTATAPFDLGRTLTHEVGHWLNLRHIWGDGGCSVDDSVADTPVSDGPNYNCTPAHVSCGTTDMVQNYMDYSDDACMNLFTQGQKARMLALFNTGGFRESLLNSNGCGTPTCGVQGLPACPTCDDGILNGDEIDVDCGGPVCPPCPCSNDDNDLNITLNFDNFPEESSWELKNDNNQVIASGGPYPNEPDGSELGINLCVPDGCYEFTMLDSYGDGMCCFYGNGQYNVTDGEGNTLASGASFGSSESTSFCLPICQTEVNISDASGWGSLVDAIACADPGETILLTSSIPNKTIDLGGTGIVIDKPITIQADPIDNIILTSNGTSPTITINSEEVLTLRGFEVRSTSVTAATVVNNGFLFLDNMSIKNGMGNPQLISSANSEVNVINSSALRK